MCGRFVREKSITVIADQFGVDEISTDLEPSYNIAPTQKVAVIVSDGRKQLVSVQWGLIPSWSKDPAIGNKLINARSETITEKASFRNAFKKRRCLIVADGFYEWQRMGQEKRPVYIRLKSGRPFGFAGLYETWKSPEGEDVTTCAIITTQANDIMKPIHDRMPVILPRSSEDMWLDAKTGSDVALELLKPYPSEEMETWPVSKMVNSPANNSPDCIKPAGGQGRLVLR
ncbi:MAG: SOS response-associated peptidase [Acidobacteriota bacterium]